MSGTKNADKPGDGRHARADRTREAIVDALLALLTEGDLKPSAERVAERAGVSRRALFHHFTDLEDLLTRAAARRLEQITPLLPIVPTAGNFAERALEYVSDLGRFYDQVAPVRRAALLVVHESKVVADHIKMAAQMHREASRAVFATELSLLPDNDISVLLAGLAAATSFAVWEELRGNQSLSPEDAAEVTLRLIEGLFASSTRSKDSQSA